jgi:hypothetical protein
MPRTRALLRIRFQGSLGDAIAWPGMRFGKQQKLPKRNVTGETFRIVVPALPLI